MATGSAARTPDFELALSEIRAVTAFAAACAHHVIDRFETERPDDPRPRAALEAALSFAGGTARSRAQRVAAPAAHRAAKDASTPAAFHAAMAAGDAAASAYLHPLADAVQVRHILRAGAHAARVLELDGDSHATGRVAELATAPAIDVLVRYPRVGVGTNRVSELMYELDAALRGESR